MVELVLPNDVNLLNNLKGGRLMHWIDIAAALTASKHSNRIVATVSMDTLDFKHPVKLGEMVKLRAELISVGKTSMNIKVTVWAENLQTGNRIMTNEASLVFVALDENERPTRVPRLSD
ncbi:MAG: acyl-CoA thioesterase [Ruminococcaceae bacterium]|nr:acyl-CoA thioesterase [Oscillospiraceae bacterium]